MELRNFREIPQIHGARGEDKDRLRPAQDLRGPSPPQQDQLFEEQPQTAFHRRQLSGEGQAHHEVVHMTS